MAQLAGSIVVADVDGYLVFKDLSAPTNSRGSNETKNYNLDVSMRPLAKPAAILFSGPNYNNLVLGNRVSEAETENRILDFTNNLFLKDYIAEIDGVNLCRNILERIDKIGDVYAYEVKLDNNDYGMECGDSWVVETETLTPRRGIIMNKTIDDTGVVFTSSGELESLIIDNGVDDNYVDDIINQVESLYSHIDISQIVLPDGTAVQASYRFTAERTYYNGNGVSFDLGDQYNGFVSGYNDLMVYVNGEPATINITNGVLRITIIQVSDLAVNSIVLDISGNDYASTHTYTLDTSGSNNFIKGDRVDAFEPSFSLGGFIVDVQRGWSFNNNAWNNEWTILKANGDGNYGVWVLLKLINNQGWVNVRWAYHSQIDNLWYGEINSSNDYIYVKGFNHDNDLNCKIKYSDTDGILYIEYYQS